MKIQDSVLRLHDVCSCMGNTYSKSMNGSFTETEASNVEVYCDYDMLGGFRSDCPNKFLWICESKVVVPDQMKMRDKKDEFLDVYKAVFVQTQNS